MKLICKLQISDLEIEEAGLPINAASALRMAFRTTLRFPPDVKARRNDYNNGWEVPAKSIPFGRDVDGR